MLSKFIKLIQKTPTWMHIALSIVLVMIILIISFMIMVKKFESLSTESLSYLDQAHKENVELVTKLSNTHLSETQRDILLRKVAIIEQNKLHHIKLIQLLSKNFYALLSMFPFLSAITAMLVFLIVQKGWQESDVYLKAYFILFTFLTSLVGIYPEVYNQSESIELHKKSYINFKRIQKTIFNYALTAPIIERDTLPFNEFVDRINTEEKKLNNLIFKIEKKALDKEIFDFGSGF